MKYNLLHPLLAVFALLPFQNTILAQAPTLGSTAGFVLFSTDGAVSNTGISHFTGHIGTNNGSSTGFGNVNGVMHDNDPASAKAAVDLLIAYNQLNAATPTVFPSPSLGSGQTLYAGVHSIAGATTLNGVLTLDARNNANAVFILKIQGSLSSGANAKVKLINGALACNVFWKVEGLVSLAAGTTLRGTIIANNAAINMHASDTLEGRALSTTGAVTADGVFAYTPIGCNSPVLIGPKAPELGTASCFAIFSSNGSVTNTGVSTIIGDVGTNVGLTTGFAALNVTGKIHPNPDAMTQQCAADLLIASNYMAALAYDIELLYPAQFGNNLVLTPHTYLLNAATVLTNNLYLNAQGNANAIFVIQIKGALSTSTHAKVILINGAQAKNVYWKITGAVDINDFSEFKGTIISNGAVNALSTGVKLDGRALTTSGALASAAVNIAITSPCIPTGIQFPEGMNSTMAGTISPNPFSRYASIMLNNTSLINNAELKIFNAYGLEVMNVNLTQEVTSLETSTLPSGIYVYKIISKNKTVQSGRLISQQ